MNQKEFIQMLDTHTELKKDLFIRGFLISDDQNIDTSTFPFYGNWNEIKKGNFRFLSHPLTGMHVYEEENGNVFFLAGHAYDPFTMEIEEEIILKDLSTRYGSEAFFEKLSEITGVYVLGVMHDGTIEYYVDPSGMQSACFGKINNAFYLSSHAQLIGDICALEMDAFVKELRAYKWYSRVMGPYLPADLTPFQEVKRVVPSIQYIYDGQVKHKRYWPLKEQEMAISPKEYQKVIEEGAKILHNNMALVAKKWAKPAISLTGGIDSNTTFAAGNGNYDHFETFSYVSAEKEVPDAKAAQTIASHFGLAHHEYQIPSNSQDIPLFEERRELFRHNNGYIAELYDNEMRKKLFLRDHLDIDVEVKSWVSETIRGYWYKHYNRKSFPKLSGKLFRNLYKIFIFNRSLAHKIDKLFDKYIQEFEYDKIPSCYPAADMHYNEVTWGSWGGLNITEMKYCFDITFIYNNRKFLDLMFRVPLEKRISDQHHLDLKKVLNKELYDMNIRVVNMKETNFRAFCLNVIFTINSILPF
ncbi:MAG: asparagine synthase-related protein [Bacillota bacterium]|nr:asparagine synthase-related protein [Bacillota bacterium]